MTSTYKSVLETIKKLEQLYDLTYYSIKPLANGAMNEVYEVLLSVNNTIKPYIFRVFLNNQSVDIDDYYDHLVKINKRFVTSNNKCLLNDCEYDTIGCSYCIYKINGTMVEVMEKYDMSLKDFMVKHNFSYSALCDKDVLNIIEFNRSTKFVDQFITYFRNNNIAHGDIKPENILVKTDGTKITKLVIADLDGLCINNKKSWLGNLKQDNNTYSCGSMAFTSMYTTKKLHQDATKENVNMIMKDVQDSDLYAVSIVVLMLWFGYDRFFTIFKTSVNMTSNFDDRWFDMEMDKSFTMSNKQSIINAYKKEIHTIDSLKNKLDYTMNKDEMIIQIDKAKNYLLKCLNLFVTIQLHENYKYVLKK